MRRKIWIAGLALLLLLAGLVGMVVVRARAADFSVNGVTDFLSDVKATIAARDTNHDGLLDSGELQSFAWMLFVMDTNKDRKLSEEELRAGPGQAFPESFPQPRGAARHHHGAAF